MTLEAHGEFRMRHETQGDISCDWTHDGDVYYFGRCECGWHDAVDHKDIHIAEAELEHHTHLEAS